MRITEYEHEPIRGLPGNLPAGEQILWQGAPDWRMFARSALFTRWIGLYFAVLAAAALVSGSIGGLIGIVVSAGLAIGLLVLFAWGVARTTVYTITNRRIVLRVGVALNKCINLPLKVIASAQLRDLGGGFGDIALEINGRHRLGYAMLWPHARPLRLGKPQPMLRALANAPEAARILAQACHQEAPNEAHLAPVSEDGQRAGLMEQPA